MKNLLLLMALLLGLTNCNDDDSIQIDVNGNLLTSRGFLIDYEVNNDFVEIFVDVVQDSLDRSVSGIDEWGLVRVRADYNNNNTLDADLDRMYAKAPEEINPNNTSLCRVLLKEANITSGCVVPDSGSYKFNFGSTVNSDVPHSNYLLRIPIEDISSSSSVNLLVEYFDGRVTTYFPSQDYTFGDVYQISW